MIMKKIREIQAVVHITSLKDQKTDFQYWQTQSYEARLATLEQVRREYNQWRYSTEPGFQRVYTIIKR
jgi:hypothetical protein